VGVALDESGNRQAARQLDHAGLRADVRLDLPVAADGDDLVPTGGDGLRLRPRLVHGDHAATAQHEVGGLDRRRRTALHRDCQHRASECDRTNLSGNRSQGLDRRSRAPGGCRLDAHASQGTLPPRI
jgi:hypothetical protein